MARLALAAVWTECCRPLQPHHQAGFLQMFPLYGWISWLLDMEKKIFGHVWLTSVLGDIRWLLVWLLCSHKEVRLCIQKNLPRCLVTIAHKLESLEKACVFFPNPSFLAMGQEQRHLGMALCISDVDSDPKTYAGSPLWSIKRMMEPAAFRGQSLGWRSR